MSDMPGRHVCRILQMLLIIILDGKRTKPGGNTNTLLELKVILGG